MTNTDKSMTSALSKRYMVRAVLSVSQVTLSDTLRKWI